MRKITALLIHVVFVWLTTPAAGQTPTAKAGPFEVEFSQVDMSRNRAYPPNTWVTATLMVTFKNVSATPVRVGLMMGWPELHLEGQGVYLPMYGTPVGMFSYHSEQTRDCAAHASNFEVVPPGETRGMTLRFEGNVQGHEMAGLRTSRVAGRLIVQSIDDNSCRPASFSASGISTQYRR